MKRITAKGAGPGWLHCLGRAGKRYLFKYVKNIMNALMGCPWPISGCALVNLGGHGGKQWIKLILGQTYVALVCFAQCGLEVRAVGKELIDGQSEVGNAPRMKLFGGPSVGIYVVAKNGQLPEKSVALCVGSGPSMSPDARQNAEQDAQEWSEKVGGKKANNIDPSHGVMWVCARVLNVIGVAGGVWLALMIDRKFLKPRYYRREGSTAKVSRREHDNSLNNETRTAKSGPPGWLQCFGVPTDYLK